MKGGAQVKLRLGVGREWVSCTQKPWLMFKRSYIRTTPGVELSFSKRYFLDEPSFTLQLIYHGRSIRRLGWGVQ
jgi:hypothetical protein